MINRNSSDEPTVSRREALTGASVMAGGLLLEACGGPSKASSSSPAAAGPAAATSATKGSSSAPVTAGPTGPAVGDGSGSVGSTRVLAALSSIPVGGAVSAVGKDNARVLVCQPTKGNVVAFSAICTHEGCTVKPAFRSLDCPCHGSKFDVATGKVLAGPAPEPLPGITVAIDGRNVVQR